MEKLLFAQTHEWIKITGDEALIGITDYAQDSMGDIVFIDLPKIGTTFAKNNVFGAVESVKAASELYIPLSGTIIDVNEVLVDQPDLINQNANETWIIKIKLLDYDTAHLLDQAQYDAFI